MYIVLDTETTGLLKPHGTSLRLQPRMTEICMIKLDKQLKEIDRFKTLVNPKIPIPEKIQKLTNITDKMVKNKPTFEEIYKKVAKFVLGSKYFVGHNVVFDHKILLFDLERIGKQYQFPWPMNLYCTIEQSKHIKGHRLKLGELYNLASGKEIEGAHRAENDVEATIFVFRWLIRAGVVED